VGILLQKCDFLMVLKIIYHKELRRKTVRVTSMGEKINILVKQNHENKFLTFKNSSNSV